MKSRRPSPVAWLMFCEPNSSIAGADADPPRPFQIDEPGKCLCRCAHAASVSQPGCASIRQALHKWPQYRRRPCCDRCQLPLTARARNGAGRRRPRLRWHDSADGSIERRPGAPVQPVRPPEQRTPGKSSHAHVRAASLSEAEAASALASPFFRVGAASPSGASSRSIHAEHAWTCLSSFWPSALERAR